MALFKKYRKDDTNLELGIAEQKEKKTYYNFSFSGANTIDKDFGERKASKNWNTLLSKDEIECLPLSEILDQYAGDKKIDLLDVDVEGYDLEVLKSNDWSKYRPSVILVEDQDFRTKLGQSEIYSYLAEKDYQFNSYCEMTLIMTAKEFLATS
jgi:FkbM family methyltransferase